MQLSKQDILRTCDAITSTKILEVIECCVNNELESTTYALINGDDDLSFYIKERTRAQLLHRILHLVNDFRAALAGSDMDKLAFMELLNVETITNAQEGL